MTDKEKIAFVRALIGKAYSVICTDKDHSIEVAWKTIDDINAVLRSRVSAASQPARSKR